MKRGKDGEKIVGPMFPRLHVNDAAEKGGPRAPPRNKMALYEQLSIPSQRFNPALLPVKPNTNYSVPPSSSNQVSSADRRNFFNLHPPLSKPTFLPKNPNSLEFGRSNSLAELGQHDESDDEDITVPVFAQLQEGLEKNQNKNNKNLTPLIPNCSHHHSMSIQTKNSGPEKNLAEVESVDGESKEADKCSQGSGNSESAREIEVANSSEPGRDSPSGNTERSDDTSEASILDSISAVDVAPDDVVGIIGQKHFWKARRAIVNQQRVFAVQVFELHRLIKVQKLIASSPHVLLEDTSTALSKQSSKSSLVTKLIVENNNKSLPPATRHRDEPEKPAHPVECSAENAVGQAPIIINKSTPPAPPTISNSGQWRPTPHQPPGQQQWLIPVMSPTEGLVYKPYSGPGFGGTGFCGPYGSSPMMMSNFMNPAYGVPAHQGMGFVPGIPNAGHSYFPTYGMPVMSAGLSGAGSGSISAIEQVNRPTEPSPGIQTVHNQRQEPRHPQLQSSCSNGSVSVPRPAPLASRIRMSKVSDLQGSTGSCPPYDRAERTQTCASQNPSSSNERRRTEPVGSKELELTNGHSNREDVLPLFPVAPAMAEDAEQLTAVIRAVPHNARSAAASAARIFRSIQEERKHHDSN